MSGRTRFPLANNTYGIDTAFADNNSGGHTQGINETNFATSGERLIYPAKIGYVAGNLGANGGVKFPFTLFTSVGGRAMLPPWGGRDQCRVWKNKALLEDGKDYSWTFDQGFNKQADDPKMPTRAGSFFELNSPAGETDRIGLETLA